MNGEMSAHYRMVVWKRYLCIAFRSRKHKTLFHCSFWISWNHKEQLRFALPMQFATDGTWPFLIQKERSFPQCNTEMELLQICELIQSVVAHNPVRLFTKTTNSCIFTQIQEYIKKGILYIGHWKTWKTKVRERLLWKLSIWLPEVKNDLMVYSQLICMQTPKKDKERF